MNGPTSPGQIAGLLQASKGACVIRDLKHFCCCPAALEYQPLFGPDVLIQAEEIPRIVGFLDLCEARVVGTES